MGRYPSFDRGSRKDVRKHHREGQQAPLSLESFAQRKGQVRALEEFHKRKNRKRLETAKALRNYRKVMKQEGFEAGKGASRKRSGTSPGGTSKETIDSTDNIKRIQANEANETENWKSRKRRKTNPFQKSLEKAKEKKEIFEQRKADTQDQVDKNQKLKQRKIQSMLLAKRTRKGQPVMKHMVENLLTKLQKNES